MTVAAWRPGGGGGIQSIDGLRVYKPLDNQLTSLDMNSGRRGWSVPVGETPEFIRTHPRLSGVDVPNTGGAGWSIQIATGSLLVSTRALSQGEAQYLPDAPVELHARDKETGEILSSIPLPAPGQYGLMTYMHEGSQYIVVQIGSIHTDFPGSLVAYRLP
tara:strand:- start:92 stop:571 length:480 start_codon:yes stop_codon:yes gene_type:complete